MAEDRRANGLRGIFEKKQGPWGFPDISSYVEGWVKPNLLGDLETVFTGSMHLWQQRNPDPGADGRGDFVLASGLFSMIDHLGSFLHIDATDPLSPSHNIPRVARRLPTTRDIVGIASFLGRHAVIHGGWPQTGIPMGDSRPVSPAVSIGLAGPEEPVRWGFGLSFNASPNPFRHDTLHTVEWVNADESPIVPVEPGVLLLKLVLNVQVLRWELANFVESREFQDLVQPQSFARVVRMTRMSGNPFLAALQTREGRPREQRKAPAHSPPSTARHVSPPAASLPSSDEGKEFSNGDVRDEIFTLRAEAERIGAWQTPNRKFRRDHLGKGSTAPAVRK